MFSTGKGNIFNALAYFAGTKKMIAPDCLFVTQAQHHRGYLT